MSESGKLGTGAYIVGGLSFIPLFGVFAGIAAVLWGLATKKKGGKILALVGLLGVLFTVFLYGSLFYVGFVQRGGVGDKVWELHARMSLTSLIQSIEYYKLENGAYPEDLETLRATSPLSGFATIQDPTKNRNGRSHSGYFYYENLGDTYYLLGTGPDDTPFTEDDIHPAETPKGNVGFRFKGQ